MDSNCRKLGETPYRECRKQAAIYNDALGSMERAAVSQSQTVGYFVRLPAIKSKC